MTGYGRAYLALCLWLLIWAQGSAGEARLAKPGSTHPSFPLDAFAKPAYKIVFQNDQPIGNQSARDILRASKRWSEDDHALQNLNDPDTSGDRGEAKGSQHAPFKAFLHRTSADTLHVCTLAQQTTQTHAKRLLDQDEEAMDKYRAGVLGRALSLLSPLKTGCLFHTHDWFTYSFCHGDALRQFRALPSTLGGGKTPAMDPTQDSYVLGRWKTDSETIRSSPDPQHTLDTGTADDADQQGGAEDDQDGLSVQTVDEEEQAGTQLMELVHFSSIESSPVSATSSGATVEGKGRYVSQYWSDGTLCIINNEPRTTEVQFHCAKSPPVDRIALIKEVTTCNYVVVIETPRLCSEPALAQVDEEVEEVHCRPILSDEALQERYQQEVRDTHASLIEGARQAEEQERRPPSSPNNLKREEESDRIEDQIGSMFEKLTKTKLAQGSAPQDQVELVVGMDEEGNFIIEPRGDRARNPEAEQDDTSGSEVFYDAQDFSGDASTTKTVLSAEKIAELVQRLRDSGLLGSGDAATLKIIQGYGTDGDGGTADQGVTPPQEDGGTKQAQPGAQRGNMMVRETETFPQRVDRIFRAREEAAQRRTQNSQEQGDGDDQNGGEAEWEGRQRHVEL